MIGPTLEDGSPRFSEGDNPPPLLNIEEGEIKTTYGCSAKRYGSVSSPDGKVFGSVSGSSTYIITHATCLHLLRSFPRLTTFQLWDLFRRKAHSTVPTLIEGVVEISESTGLFSTPSLD